MPDNDSLRFDRVYEAIEMVLVNGDNEDEKTDFCIELAIKLGVRMAVAGVLVKKIIAGMQTKKTQQAIKAECANFLNY